MNRPLVVGILSMCLHFLTLGSELLAEVPECGFRAQPGDTIARMVQTTRNLAVVLVDFADGRVPGTGEPPMTGPL